jgi:hypothetical protein
VDELDPRASDLDLRASDAERDRTVTELRRHLVDGRLTMDEFDERSGEALRARTRRDLLATLRELPARADKGLARRAPRAERTAGLPAALPALLPALVVAALVALAALSGSWWLLWLIWPALVVTRGAMWRRARYGNGPGAWYGWGACGGHRRSHYRIL